MLGLVLYLAYSGKSNRQDVRCAVRRVARKLTELLFGRPSLRGSGFRAPGGLMMSPLGRAVSCWLSNYRDNT